jgi:hypothetical protein
VTGPQWTLALAIGVASGCHEGVLRGTGAACDPARPCPAHYACTEFRCQPDTGADAAASAPASVDRASTIQDVSYEVRASPAGGPGGTICTSANPPDPVCGGRRPIDKCRGVAGRCTIVISWAGSFGGDGELGADPCPFIVKDVLGVRYACSHDGRIRYAAPADFPARGTPDDCIPRPLGTATLNCP